MALKRSGVTLVAENYNDYITKMRNINKAHQEAFKTQPQENYQRATRQTGQASKGAVSGINAFLGSIVKVAAKVAIAVGALKLFMDVVNLVAGAGDLAARVETLSVSLNQVGVEAGYSKKQIDFAVESLRNTGITTKSAQQSLLRLTRANIQWSEATKLARIAQDSAVIAGMDSSAAFDRLILGIQKQEPELLDELGITLRRSDAYRTLAKELGVSEKALTDQQKSTAILNEIYRQSTAVTGAYEAAMETAGKQQGSLVRKIEETQLNIGKLLLPLKSASIEFQTNFWNGMQAATKGLQAFIPAVEMTKEGLKAVTSTLGTVISDFLVSQGVLKKGQGFWDALGEAIFNFGKMTSVVVASAGAAIETFFDRSQRSISRIGESWKVFREHGADAAKAFLLAGKAQDQSFTEEYIGRQTKAIQEMLEKYPILETAWEDVGKVAETSLDKQTDGTEDLAAALKKAEDQLKAQIDAYKRIESIQRNYSKSVQDQSKRLEKDLDKFDKESAKKRENLSKKQAKKVAEFEEDSSYNRQKIIDDFHKKEVEFQKKANRDMEREHRRFLLTQQQATRRFQVQDRRLRAEGDVLALMELREDFALQQKEAQENHAFDQTEKQKSIQEQSKLRQEDLQEKLREFDEEISRRREKMDEQHKEEINALRVSLDERKQALLEADKERLQQIIEQRDKEIEELGRTLEDEGKLTKEGMELIAAEIAKVFDSDGAGDALIKGWNTRSQSEIGRMITEAKAQLEGLADEFEATAKAAEGAAKKIQDMAAAGASKGDVYASKTAPSSPSKSFPYLPTIHKKMRQGGMGVVTGPAAFEVEPGQREAVMFAPLPTSSNLNVNMQGGFDIRGAEPAGREATEAALDTMVLEFQTAVERLARRGAR